jgi:hypothetical protein
MTKRNTPVGLGPAGRELYKRLVADFEIDDAAGRALLLNAAQAADRVAEASKAIADDGLFLTDRLGRRYTHPAQQVEVSAGKALLAALRGLKLAPGSGQ